MGCGSANSPQRSCFACRGREEKKLLLRFYLHEGAVNWDCDHTAGGRGVYLHPTKQCLVKNLAPGAWGHAFRRDGGSIVSSQLKQCLERVAKEVLGIELRADASERQKKIRL